MDYIYAHHGIIVEMVKFDKEKQFIRLLAYCISLSRIQNKGSVVFWEWESALEQKLYRKMKRWEERHPIIGIVTCTILGGILLSLIAGIILEAIMIAI